MFTKIRPRKTQVLVYTCLSCRKPSRSGVLLTHIHLHFWNNDADELGHGFLPLLEAKANTLKQSINQPKVGGLVCHIAYPQTDCPKFTRKTHYVYICFSHRYKYTRINISHIYVCFSRINIICIFLMHI